MAVRKLVYEKFRSTSDGVRLTSNDIAFGAEIAWWLEWSMDVGGNGTVLPERM